MIPASTARLLLGDVCFVPRIDGGFVPLIFICAPKKTRSAFYGALVHTIIEEPKLELVPVGLAILTPALVHISCYKENATPIVGNIADRIRQDVLRDAAAAVGSREIGSVSKVWGHKAIVKYANAVT